MTGKLRAALLAASIIQGMAACAAPAASQATAPPPISLSGSSGLVRIPSADVLPYGDYSLGVNFLEAKYRSYWASDTMLHFASVAVFPRVEVTARITNIDGRLGVQYYDLLPGQPFGGWNFDRAFGVHVQLLKQSERLPQSLAVGAQDVTGTTAFGARYRVASHRQPRYGIHLGTGDGFLGTLFAGVDYQPHPKVRIAIDHDGNRANIGCTIQIQRLLLMPTLSGFRSFGGGIAYWQRM